jgi:signal peptide peptidase SppA
MIPLTKKRKLGQLQACINDGQPWFIVPSAFASISQAIESGDMDSLENAMSFGGESESQTKIIDGVAVLSMTGVLRDTTDIMVRMGFASSYQQFETEFAKVIGNPEVKGVMIYGDSPGGSAIGCKRVADMIFAARDQKPVYFYSQGICGSACYYIASACSHRSGTADSLWGSIGTIYKHQEISGMLKEYGVTATVFTNTDSPAKGVGNDSEPLTDEAKKQIQEFVDSYGSGFIQDVARYRGVDSQVVISDFGKGDAFRADVAVKKGMVDSIVSGFNEAMSAISSQLGGDRPVSAFANTSPATSPVNNSEVKKMDKVRAQLFAMGMIASMEATDETCNAVVSAFCSGKGIDVPDNESGMLEALQGKSNPPPAPDPAPASNVAEAHKTEQGEARLQDLRASAALLNSVTSEAFISDAMVMDAFEAGQNTNAAIQAWNETISKKESSVPTSRANVTAEGSDQFAQDAIDAMVYRSSDNPQMQISDGAAALSNRPLWAIAGQALQIAGRQVDMYGSRELIAEEAMQMGGTGRQTFFSTSEDRRYVQNSGIPNARPGDFPNILSGLANKFLDSIELDEDYSYGKVSALLPGGLNDFKPGLMVNKGVVEELDELQDAEQFKELGMEEEVLSYVFLRRFGNKFGWTPVMIANDDLNAFAEGMIGLAEAWQVTQNRLVIDRFTSNETLLDGYSLFANRPDTGTGTNPAANDNDKTSGGAPSDSEWAAMEVKYADIGGINTGKRVRGTLNTCFVPTGARAQEARRTFFPLAGLEPKAAATTANVGLYRGDVGVITESELRSASDTTWYGLRNPTRLNTATVVRAYFNGFGTAGRRERWYDPGNKTTYISLEGRVATAVKNWRYAVRNVA